VAAVVVWAQQMARVGQVWLLFATLVQQPLRVEQSAALAVTHIIHLQLLAHLQQIK
jgi:hypothetical protein